jgi:protein kinase C substrate 80K-H
MMPPAFFLEVVDEYCRKMEVEGIDPSQSCVSGDVEIPGSVSDGMYGYYSTLPREDNDTASIMFRGLDSEDDSDEQSKLNELMSLSATLQNEIQLLETAISEERETLGENEDGISKYGREGELYKLKDMCFEITAGKYTYELCLFQSAKQKEGTSRGGTDLGRWSGSSLTEEGHRLWTWENGTKCWNGPKRSAWAYITCGETTRIISADEPETCKYVFEVESHIACDEQYRILHGLS